MRGFALSKAYTHDRLQGRPPSVRNGMPFSIIQHPDVKRMLLQQKVYAERSLALYLYCTRLVVTREDPGAASLLGLLTPVAKAWSSEFGLAANDLAIEIHGGYGYMQDFDVEQLYRDSRLDLIHEGTTAIQAIDLLGRKVVGDGGRALKIWRTRVLKTCSQAELIPKLTDHAVALRDIIFAIDTTIATLHLKRFTALDNANIFLRAFDHTAVAWLWLDLACTAEKMKSHLFSKGIDHACRFFYDL